MAKPSLGLLLDRERAAFDELVAEAFSGVRGPDHFEALEERASGIADRLRAAFRKPA